MTQGRHGGSAGSPARLEAEVDQARLRLGDTIEALEARLSPERLVDEAVSMVRRHGTETATNLGLSVKQNPAALLLIGGGLLWLLKGPRPQAIAAAGFPCIRARPWPVASAMPRAPSATRRGT